MPLSNDEIDTLVDKLLQKYREYSDKYSKSWFNLEPFMERFKHAQKNRMNLEGFILSEISHFEKLREKYETKKSKEPFSKKIDMIIEENLEKIKKYPRIEFHKKAGLEISHMYGAMINFCMNRFPVLWMAIKDSVLRNELKILDESLSPLGVPRGNRPSRLIEDHSLLLSRPNVSSLEIEKAISVYLRECAFALYDVIDLCDKIFSERPQELEFPIQFGNSFMNDDRKKVLFNEFKNDTGYGAVLKIKSDCENIIQDFRLKAFKRR